MTKRARGYLTVTALRHVAVGIVCLALPNDFKGDSYQIIIEVLPIGLWGLLFLAGGAHLGYAAVKGDERQARIGLSLSAVSTSLWAAGFFMAYFVGGIVTLIGGILWTALTLKDLVVCAQPMRSPFERITREYVGPQAR
ncbi:hypothetical protein [Nocardioides lijunqiniae]|uniref:hypothetical protein n=1 Tax=Nocardioides lijunqiniae TaxID=2760832 RepID=UPI0018784DC1|nr:hypothetical protein [Nocardioides lijunqiniae]